MAKQITRTEPAPYRVRAWKDGRLVVDSGQAVLAWGLHPYPVWAFPEGDVHLPDDEGITHRQDGRVVVRWPAADEWWEEDDRIFGGHPRSPEHRVDARHATRHVKVSVDGLPIAESQRPVIVAETSLPNRYYLPRSDVDFTRLRRSDRTSWCPYKGQAFYYDIVRGDEVLQRGALWSYEHAHPDTPPALLGLIGLWHEKLDVTVDGEAI